MKTPKSKTVTVELSAGGMRKLAKAVKLTKMSESDVAAMLLEGALNVNHFAPVITTRKSATKPGPSKNNRKVIAKYFGLKPSALDYKK